MSKMNELSLEEQEAAYEEYLEYQRQELRKEGAEELRAAILRDLAPYLPDQGVELAKAVVLKAFI